MDPITWQQAKELIANALERPASERQEYVREHCPDPDLCVEIQELLANADTLSDFLEPKQVELLAPGTRLGRYEIISLVATGGMGEVYRASDPRLNRCVAIKIMPAVFKANAVLVRRFEQEAHAAATLNHPNILSIHDVGLHEGRPYIVSELLDGVSLRELVDAPLPIRKALQYAIDVCHGLAAAHDLGIVHRDLKPENLVVTRDGRLKIVDFGVAKLIEIPHNRSGTGAGVKKTALATTDTMLGTVGYMSPEQVAGRVVDHRSDLFSAGAVFYELISGTRAFSGASAVETLAAILRDEPTDFASQDAMSVGMFTIIRRCLEKDPSRRFQSALDVAFALEAIASLGRVPGDIPGIVDTLVPGSSDHSGLHRVIVLPFDNLSQSESDDWLAGALSDSLTFGLRTAENIIIVNRQHAGNLSDPRQLFEALGVRYCVKGTYQRVADDLKVVARLIDASTGTIAVQESVTDRFSNLFSLEETIAGRFAAAFEQTRVQASHGRPSSLAAYKRLSQARELHSTGRYAEAVHHLEVAVRQDQEYSDAWALLANSYARLTAPATSDDQTRREYQRSALAAALRAVQLDPMLYEAQVALALAYRGMEQVELWRTAAL
jgi:serine/threonine protein kinase